MSTTTIRQLLALSRSSIAGLGLLLLGVAPLSAQTPMPPVVSYQGFLTTPAGAPLSGTFALTFRLYEVGVNGSILWEEIHPAVTISNGVFNVFLGSIAPLLDDPDIREFDRPFFLGVAINGAAELTPRLPLASLPVMAQAKGPLSTVAVDCGAGQSIGEAIARAPVGGRLTVTLSGNCTENLVIERDFVILDGGGTATLTGVTPNPHPGNAVVYLDGVRSIEIIGLTIGPATNASGTGMHGLLLDHVSSATLRESTVVENHDGNGILLQASSQLDLNDSFVRGNRLNGVYARHGSNADIIRSEIRNNLRSGVFLHRRASGKFNSSTVVDNGDGVEEPGFCKCALFIDEGSQARVYSNNTFRSNAAHGWVGAAIAVYRGSSLRFEGSGTLVENTVFNPVHRDARVHESDVGVALVVEQDSVLRVSGGTVTIRGWVTTFNLSTVDLRNVNIVGHVGVYELGGNYRMRDQSGGALDQNGVPVRVSLTGDIIMLGGDLSIRTPPNSQAARIDGNIDCGGGGGVPSNALFQNPEDGYLDCPGVRTDLETIFTGISGVGGVGGAVTFDVSVTNIKRSPAVEARGDVNVLFEVRSADSFGTISVDTTASPTPGSCDIEQAQFVNGIEWQGTVNCYFDSIVLSFATAEISVSSYQADLNVQVSASASNGDDNDSNDSDTITVTY